jgi:hypothetical protein
MRAQHAGLIVDQSGLAEPVDDLDGLGRMDAKPEGDILERRQRAVVLARQTPQVQQRLDEIAGQALHLGIIDQRTIDSKPSVHGRLSVIESKRSRRHAGGIRRPPDIGYGSLHFYV